MTKMKNINWVDVELKFNANPYQNTSECLDKNETDDLSSFGNKINDAYKV